MRSGGRLQLRGVRPVDVGELAGSCDGLIALGGDNPGVPFRHGWDEFPAGVDPGRRRSYRG